MSKFKVGDKVKILPSATIIGVSASEVGKMVEVKSVYNINGLMVSDSRGGEYRNWCVNDYDITSVFVKGQQLLFSFMTE